MMNGNFMNFLKIYLFIALNTFAIGLTYAQADLQTLVSQLQKYDAPQKEAEVGRMISAKILGSTPLLNNQSLSNYLNLVGKTLVKNTATDSYRWTFAVIESNDVNAFAAPGGYIFLTKGLLKELNSEDELAAVIAHEIAHVRLKHYMKVAKKQLLAEFSMKSLNQGSADAQLEALSNTATLILARGLDKQSEFDADRESAIILAKSGYDPSAMVDVLSMLEKKSKASDKSMSFLLATHPHPSQRLQALGACCADSFAQYSNKNPKTKNRFDSFLKSKI